jgi:hypothetical protein
MCSASVCAVITGAKYKLADVDVFCQHYFS